jgi:hypothetical protein
MQTKILAAFLVLMVAALANGFQGSPEWVEYTSEEGRYSTLFPKQPKLVTQEATAKTGEKFIQYIAQSSDADGLYGIGYFDILPNMVYSLNDGRDGILNAIQGTLLKEEAISLGGNPGKELKVSAKSGNLDLLIRVRYYSIGRRIYYLQHLFQKSSDTPAMAEKTARFFNSFKVMTPRQVATTKISNSDDYAS